MGLVGLCMLAFTIIDFCQSDSWKKAAAGLNTIINTSISGSYSFEAYGGELILANVTAFASGGHDAIAVIVVNGSDCNRSYTNGHERRAGTYAGASCVSTARAGSNTVSVAGSGRLIVVGN